MNKKPDLSSGLAGIISAKRGTAPAAASAAAVVLPPEPPDLPSPSPALPVAPARLASAKAETPAIKGRGGKSSDPNYSQYSVYLPKSLRKKVGRALDDADDGRDFSDLMQDLLEKWLKSST